MMFKEDPPGKTIQELFEMYPADYIEDEEIDWASPVGRELLRFSIVKSFVYSDSLRSQTALCYSV